MKEIIVDNFAGGGGASTGIEIATGRSVDIAINHDPEAIRMHQANHPDTKHYCESVWDVDPVVACLGRPVALAWFSPDCKHFSKAKGDVPVEKEIRGLAWVTVRWASLIRPRVIMLENVEEFRTWGALRPKRDKKTGRVLVKEAGGMVRIADVGEIVPVKHQLMEPNPKKKGLIFKRFIKALQDIGYNLEFKELVAADYGTPTMRKRFFMIARCDGQPIIWPEPTHAPLNSPKVRSGVLPPYVGAYTQLDFSLPCPSIFESAEEIKEKYGIRANRPLAEKTMERIARGLKKFVIDNDQPFIIQLNYTGASWDYCNKATKPLPVITSVNGFGIVKPYIMQIGQTGFTTDRSNDIKSPLTTIVSKNEHCLIAPTLIQYHTARSAENVRGQTIDKPIMTVDGSNRYGLVTSFLHKYFGGGYGGFGAAINEPLPTVTAIDHNSLCATTLIQMNNHCDGRDIKNPIPTSTAGDGHFAEVRAFLIKYYGQGVGQDIHSPLDTVTTNDRFGLITIKGVDYRIIDIGLRMLEPKELYACQGFPDDYIIDRDINGKKHSRTEQVKRCGNAVCPPIPAALVRANLPELCTGKRRPNLKIAEQKNGQLKFA